MALIFGTTGSLMGLKKLVLRWNSVDQLIPPPFVAFSLMAYELRIRHRPVQESGEKVSIDATPAPFFLIP